MYEVSRNQSKQRSSEVLRGGSTFTPPQKRFPHLPKKNLEVSAVENDFDKKNRCKDISAEQCAPALQILTTFYRIFGFSFSGVLIVRTEPPKTSPESQNDKPKFGNLVWFISSASSVDLKSKTSNLTTKSSSSLKSTIFSPLRIALLLYNLIIVTSYIFPVVTDYLPIQMTKRLLLGIHGAEVREVENTTNSNLRPLNFGEYFARTGDDETVSLAEDSFAQLKPVIRTIIRSLVTVFFLEGAVSFAHNFLFGGRLLRRLAAISTQDLEARALQGKSTCSRKHAVIVISLLLLLIPLLMSAGIAAFNQETSKTTSSINFFTASRLKKLAIHWWHFIALSTYSTLFVVSMLMIGRRLEEMTTKVEASKKKKFKSFGEQDLAALYQRVEALLGHFQSTVTCFSLPITFTLAASTFTLIGSVCFLMISPDRSYASFIFSIGLFALLRLFVVASSGNLATSAYGKLLRTVYEAMDEDQDQEGDEPWSVDAWLLFGELRRLKSEFKVAFFAGTFTVRQSSILSLVGFSIQYIVILLQTENYDGGNFGSLNSSSIVTGGNWQ